MNVKAIVSLGVVGIMLFELLLYAVGLLPPVDPTKLPTLNPTDSIWQAIHTVAWRNWIFILCLVALWLVDCRQYFWFCVLFYLAYVYFEDQWVDIPCTKLVGFGAPFVVAWIMALFTGLRMRNDYGRQS